MQETLEKWTEESAALRAHVATANGSLSSIDESLKAMVGLFTGFGKFAKRFGPWIIAVGGFLMGVSPTLIKAGLAAFTGITPP